MVEVRVEPGSAEFFRHQEQCLSASKASIYAGLSLSTTPYTEWSQGAWNETVRSVDRDAVDAFKASEPGSVSDVSSRRGIQREPLVLSEYQQRTGYTLLKAYPHVHRTYSWLRATPDAFTCPLPTGAGGIRITVEAKAPYYGMYEWPKLEHLCQVIVQMGVTECPMGDLAYLYVPTITDPSTREERMDYDKKELCIWRVHHSKPFWEWMLQRILLFRHCKQHAISPEGRIPLYGHAYYRWLKTGFNPKERPKSRGFPPRIYYERIFA